jgi:hypothetical protein
VLTLAAVAALLWAGNRPDLREVTSKSDVSFWALCTAPVGIRIGSTYLAPIETDRRSSRYGGLAGSPKHGWLRVDRQFFFPSGYAFVSDDGSETPLTFSPHMVASCP